MRNVCAFAIVCLSAAESTGAQTTDEALSSPRVRKVLAVSQEGGRLVVCADVLFSNLLSQSSGSCRTTQDSPLRYVASAGNEIQVAWAGFNPLLVNVTGTITTAPDPAQAALASIADAIRGIGTTLSRAETETARADTDAFLRSVDAYQQLLLLPIVEPADVEAWKTRAAGRPGILLAREEMKKASAGLTDHFNNVDAALTAIDRAAHTVDERTIALTIRTSNPSALAQKRRLQKAIQALDESLAEYANGTWIGDALVVNSITVSADDETTDLLAIRKVSLSLRDGALVQSLGEATKLDLRLRAYRRFVAESAVGVVHTKLRKAVYKAVEEGDHLIVTKGENEAVDLSAAAVVNLVCRCSGTPGLNPLLQIGVSSSADMPAILLGGGVRLRGKLPVSISGGVVLAWLKDLDQLSPGDTVASDLEIEADLKRHFTGKAYFGLQFKF